MEIGELSPKNCFVFEQRTNFDKVTISPKTLAEALYGERPNELPIWCEGRACEDFNGDCKECFENWLKQEAEEGE